MTADVAATTHATYPSSDLIGPLTPAEWCTFRYREDDDILSCCAETSELRDAIFHTLRMGGAREDGVRLRRLWPNVERHEPLGRHPLMVRLRRYYVEETS